MRVTRFEIATKKLTFLILSSVPGNLLFIMTIPAKSGKRYMMCISAVVLLTAISAKAQLLLTFSDVTAEM